MSIEVLVIPVFKKFSILVVGDLHGDLGKTRSALEIAGVLSSDEEYLWTGGETVCVFFALLTCS